MKKIDFCETLSDINDNYIKEAHIPNTKKTPIWIKWCSIAACLCLISISTVWYSQNNTRIKLGTTLPHNESTQTELDFSLLSYLNNLNITAQLIDNQHFISNINRPKVIKESLIDSIKQNPTIQGNISKIESVSVQDNNATWYITAMTITVDEVLTGNIDSNKVNIVLASVIYGEPSQTFYSPSNIAGLYEGFKGVFVLRTLENISWNVAGKELLPTDLGEYGLNIYLDREDDTLIFREQDVRVQIDELQ